MVYEIYCWFWKKRDERLRRKIEALRKKELLLRKRYRTEMDELLEKVILHNSLWGVMAFQFWYDRFWDRGGRRCRQLDARIERLEDLIERLENRRCKMRLDFLPYSLSP